MKKKFNVTGICYPEQHYMMDNNNKLSEVMELIEFGEYFTINRPRQYGKTTTLHFLMERLNSSDTYFPIALNFQGIDRSWHESDYTFAQMFANQLFDFFEIPHLGIADFIKEQKEAIHNLDDLSKVITHLVNQFDKKLVLLIDEVDASSNYDAFLSFLGMLRTKYLARKNPRHYTFHSIILAGAHDIKSLKYKLRNSKDAQYNSPWNIATDFNVDMSFNPKEIAPMLEQYSEAEGVIMDIAAIAERLHYHTAGYPFLVSRLCKIVAEEILPKREVKTLWTLDDIEEAVQILLLENNTNFDSLIKNLENHQDLYDLTFRILIDGDKVAYNPDNSVIKMGILYGVFKRNGHVKIHNRIYEQRIYNYMASNMEVGLKKAAQYNFENQFYLPDNGLDVEKILLKFQEFMKMEYSDKDQDFLEREWRLIFLAFIRPIVNGSGYTFKEPQISQEKRLDVVITFFQRQYIAELKRWNGLNCMKKE
ncbi:MAG: AAA-like domain-containing protein [Chitinophagales bacterium]